MGGIVYKFGGTTLASRENFLRVVEIIRSRASEKVLIVVSARGKVTRLLEQVVQLYFSASSASAENAFADIVREHIGFAESFFPVGAFTRVVDRFCLYDKQVRDLLTKPTELSVACFSDQIVSVGELFSSVLLSEYLQSTGVTNQWVDVRELLVCDGMCQNANILWDESARRVDDILLPLWAQQNLLITQGFIARHTQKYTVTIGKEGSDWSAAILTLLTHATQVHIFKDVPGIMNADPQLMATAQTIPHISYHDLAETAKAGARVIHPKTVLPLYEKQIPLFVRSVYHPHDMYTQVGSTHDHYNRPDMYVRKDAQMLVHVRSQQVDCDWFDLLANHAGFSAVRNDCTLIIPKATELFLCMDEYAYTKVEECSRDMGHKYSFSLQKGMSLLTLYNGAVHNRGEWLHNAHIIVHQQTQNAAYFLVRTEELPLYSNDRKQDK